MPDSPRSSALSLLKGGDVQGFLGRYADVALAALVVAIVGMMIVPLPTALLDLLITFNIAIAVTLLLISIYVGDALKIATFPTLLLITTLFRLALEVSATRLILLKADAGHVIDAFGNFVVSGNLVVGAVIFLILTMIQFIVIAKGSERVAEVGARFTLDAMPGKQMSIDAELRAGHIDNDEARSRRAALARESQFFGSMDGAMKFVKGDAIAGIIILTVNIIGGLIIGIVQRDMDAAQAAKTYTILTIGEGLVAQIPALIISTAAGIIVTRVSSEEEGAELGKEIGRQVLDQPKALAIAAVLLGLFALVPGLPTLPFLALAGTMGFVARRISKSRQGRSSALVSPGGTGPTVAAHPAAQAGHQGSSSPAALVPLSIHVGASLAHELRAHNPDQPPPGSAQRQAQQQQAQQRQASDPRTSKSQSVEAEAALAAAATEIIPALQQKHYQKTGLPLSGVTLTVGRSLPPQGYSISLQEVPLASVELPEQGLMVVTRTRADEEALAGLSLAKTQAEHPDGLPAFWVEPGHEDTLKKLGLSVLTRGAVVVAHVLSLLQRHGHLLLGVQETQSLLAALDKTHPALVGDVVPKVVSPARLADVLRRLAEERISVRGLREILEALSEWAPRVSDPVELTEHVRGALRRQITHQFSQGGALFAHLLDPLIEDTIKEAVHRTDAGTYLALQPELAQDIVTAVKAAVGIAGTGVVVTNVEVRRYVRRLLEAPLPNVGVLSFQELDPNTQIQPLGRITIGA